MKAEAKIVKTKRRTKCKAETYYEVWMWDVVERAFVCEDVYDSLKEAMEEADNYDAYHIVEDDYLYCYV
ncbi:hypothetical protein LCGC14_0234800 [marine sediment metagenome]|uniref:Uncharacterized protein n=1 Tax=marine sediment metagenome TaxID=412755 RepID=A0A0F9UD92_9ZZZZ